MPLLSIAASSRSLCLSRLYDSKTWHHISACLYHSNHYMKTVYSLSFYKSFSIYFVVFLALKALHWLFEMAIDYYWRLSFDHVLVEKAID